MYTRLFALIGALVLLLNGISASGQANRNTEPSTPSIKRSNDAENEIAIIEVGASTNWNISGGAATFAPNLAVECTPVDHWLEIEAGVSPFFTRTSSEWDTDLLIKKPWTLSKTAEFMAGVGPQWSHLRQSDTTSNIFSAELAADFMFWPSAQHRFGWYLEPAYSYSFSGGHQQSIGISGGILITIR